VLLGSFTEARNRLNRLAFSPCGRWLVGMGPGRLVHRWDLTTKTWTGPIRPDRGDIQTLTFNSDGRLLVLTTNDRMLRFVEILSGIEIASFVLPFDVRELALAPDDLTMVLVGKEQVEVWARADRAESWRTVALDRNTASTVAFSSSGDRLVLGRAGCVQSFEMCERGGRPILEWDRVLPGMIPLVLDFHDQSRKLALLGEMSSTTRHHVDDRPNPASLLVLDAEGGVELFRRDSHGNRLKRNAVWQGTFQFSPHLDSGEKWLARCAGTAVVLEKLMKQEKGVELESSGRESLTALAFAPDGQTLASADANGTVQLWPWRRLVEA
jgi:WD40 repeat protein